MTDIPLVLSVAVLSVIETVFCVIGRVLFAFIKTKPMLTSNHSMVTRWQCTYMRRPTVATKAAVAMPAMT